MLRPLQHVSEAEEARAYCCSQETARSSVSIQDAAQFRQLGKMKPYRWLLDPRRKQLCVGDCLLGETADD